MMILTFMKQGPKRSSRKYSFFVLLLLLFCSISEYCIRISRICELLGKEVQQKSLFINAKTKFGSDRLCDYFVHKIFFLK